jgi:hypothetical protein
LLLARPVMSALVERRATLHELDFLHRALSTEIFGLERDVEDAEPGERRLLMAAYLLVAMTLRDRLTRVSCEPHATLVAMPSFDRLLAEAALGAYRWAVTQVSEVRHLANGQSGSPSSQWIPVEDLCVFHDLGRLWASFGGASGRSLVKTLDAIDEVIYRLLKTRDQIEQLTCRRAV